MSSCLIGGAVLVLVTPNQDVIVAGPVGDGRFDGDDELTLTMPSQGCCGVRPGTEGRSQAAVN